MTMGGDQTQEHIVAERGVGVVFDPAWTTDLDVTWFDPAYWREQHALREQSGGRGGVFVIDTPVGEGVLRHYRRGGMAARVSRDRFLWKGRQAVRSLREYRLLRHLHEQGLPVPRPIGGAWRRLGAYYRADLITERVANSQSLSGVLPAACRDADIATRIGACLGRFHAYGVCHADLNAHNILLGEDGSIHLLDFDRGRLRPPHAAWQRANLHRLHRSLLKISAQQGTAPDWLPTWWATLLDAHAEALAAK